MEKDKSKTGRFFRPSPLIEGRSHLDLSVQLNYPVSNSPFTIHSQITEQELEEMLLRIIRKIWRNKGFNGEITEKLVKYFADEYWKAATAGYGNDLITIDFNTPDYILLEKLQENVWQFSAAKNYSQLRALSDALLDPGGSLRSFKDFQIAATQINSEQVGPWLQAEYNFAVAGGQMAAKWQRIQENKEDLPFLKYVTVGDDRVRPAHRELEGIIRPVDDKFWNTYFPPNGWNCRCTVQQILEGKVTRLTRIITPDKMPDLFKVNLGKMGLIFPPDHPYYDGLPDDIKTKADELRQKYS